MHLNDIATHTSFQLVKLLDTCFEVSSSVYPIPLALSEMQASLDSFLMVYCYPAGSPRVTSLAFSDQSRTFICTSTGGPATTVTWRRDSSPLVVDGVTYRQTQTVTDATTATYQNVLTIAQSVTNIYGVYRCIVGNARGTSNGVEVTGECTDHLNSFQN